MIWSRRGRFFIFIHISWNISTTFTYKWKRATPHQRIMPPRIFSATLSIFLILSFLLTAQSCRQDSCEKSSASEIPPLPNDTAALSLFVDSARKSHDNLLLCYAANKLGKTCRDASRFAQAIEAHNIALEAAEALPDSLLIAQTLNNLGTVYRRVGLMPQAADFHYKALEVSETLPPDLPTSIKARVVSLNGLGNVYMTLNNYSQAEQNLRQALLGERLLGSDLGMAINYANLGSIFESQGLLDSADVYYDMSMALNKKTGSDLGVALCHTYHGQLSEKRGNLSSAIDEYEAAYNLLQGSKDEWHALTPCLAMARVNMNAGADAMALHYLNEAKTVAQRIGSVEHLADIYRLYYEVYDRQGDTRRALDAFRTADRLADSLVNTKTINEVQNVRLNIERARQQSRVDEAERKAVVQRQEKYVGISVLAALLILAAALLALTVYWLRVRKRQQQLSIELQQAKDRFFTNITHEFRTPLTVIIAAADDIIKRNPDSPDDARDARTINSQSASLLNLINQLLDIAKLKQGAQANAPTWRRGDVAAFMSNIAGAYVNMAAARGVKFSVSNCATDMADVVPDYAERICRNLISNAIKFTPEGGSVNLSFIQTQGLITMTVSDTGIGMTPQQQSRVFEPFYQAKQESAEIGTGIGLSLVKAATTAMGWSLSLKSELGRGSQFTVTIPTAPTHPDAVPLVSCSVDAEVDSLPNSSLPQDDPEDDELKSTVLVIEDNPDVAYFIGRQLSPTHRVVYAADGTQGWQKAQEVLPDVIVTDVMMPGIDGVELCRLVRKNQLTAHIPLVMVTAKAAHDDRLVGLEAGADAYLEKPFHADELILVVGKLIESRSRLRALYSRIVEAPQPDKVAAQEAPTAPQEECSPSERSEITAIDAKYLAKIVDTIRSMMPNGEVDLCAVADALCVTRHQLNRKVNALCGMSTSNLVKQIRIARAKELLAESDLPVGDIAMQCGVDSVAYFSALFKKMTGVTPSQFRSENQKMTDRADVLP